MQGKNAITTLLKRGLGIVCGRTSVAVNNSVNSITVSTADADIRICGDKIITTPVGDRVAHVTRTKKADPIIKLGPGGDFVTKIYADGSRD